MCVAVIEYLFMNREFPSAKSTVGGKKKSNVLTQNVVLERRLMGNGAPHQCPLGKAAELPFLSADNCVCKLNVDTGFI